MTLRNTKILIVTSGYGASGVGEQFLGSMLRSHDKSRISRFSLVTERVALESDMHGYKTDIRYSSFSVLPALSSIHYWRFNKLQLPRTLIALKKIVDERKIDAIWVVLNGALTIQLGALLHANIDVPYIAHVWDAPEYLIKKMSLDPLSKNHLLNSFARTLQSAVRAVVVSDSMGRMYSQKYSVETKTMVFCPPLENWHEVQSTHSENRIISVVFAGSLYAYKEWNALLSAIEWYNSIRRDRIIKVTCIGNVSRWAIKKAWVEYIPLIPAVEAATLVNDADIAYLPYWMDKSHSLFVKTAFPGKMSFYVASGTPVLYHGPNDSTPTEFLRNYRVGVACHSMRAEEIIQSINKILSKDFQVPYIAEIKRALDTVFHPDRCVEIFEETLKEAIMSDEHN